jgi:spore coat polysaccharide biosynthesis predicted glycosyltransferase SpsG
MSNKYGIPEEDLKKIRARDKKCVYCHKNMLSPYVNGKHSDSATIEHFREEGPFYVNKGLKVEDIAICCGACNSSRLKMKLTDWFKTKYCLKNNINENAVAEPVREFLSRIK